MSKGKSIRLPEEALRKLGVKERSLVALVQRGSAVAVKRFEVTEKEGEQARIVDFETPQRVTRTVETNPLPERVLSKLREQRGKLTLRHDLRGFLKGRQTFEAWKARRVLGIAEPSDEELRKELVTKRLEKQREDGSWEGQLALTARNLMELVELGVGRDTEDVQRAVNWLMRRPESSYNPGMFFVKDELVKRQAEVIERRRRLGPGERFRERRGSEVRLVQAGDDLLRYVCGPRIMWPTALVLEALLKLGYEEDERVQRALRMLMMGNWCECAYQHGLSGLRRKEPYSMEEIAEIEKDYMEQYKYGGLSSPVELKTGSDKMPRIARGGFTAGVHEYPLKMPEHLQGCELMITRALSQVQNRKMRRLAEAHLWRFAARQGSADGRFAGKTSEKYFAYPQVAFLKLFADYDHPVSELVILRSIPWIVRDQNEDGSWGDESNKDSSTLAVVCALKSVGLV